MATFAATPYAQLFGSQGPVNALAYSSPSSSNSYILAGSSDRSIRLYNPASQPSSPHRGPPIIATYASHAYPVLSITVAPSNSIFASTSTSDRSIFLWDVGTSTILRRFSPQASTSSGPASRMNCVTFAGANGDNVLVSGGFDRAVRIWDVRAQNNKKEIMVLTDARDSVEVVVASCGPSGSGWKIMSGSSDGRLRSYDIRMATVMEDVIGVAVTSLWNSETGTAVLVSGLDSKLRLMDTQTGACFKIYKDDGHGSAHQAFINREFRIKSCFGARERWVLSGNENTEGKDGDGEVTVWDTLTGDVVQRVRVEGLDKGKKKIGSDGMPKEKANVISCIAWKDNGNGDQWCCAGTDGVVNIFETR